MAITQWPPPGLDTDSPERRGGWFPKNRQQSIPTRAFCPKRDVKD
jgi:hypothetical protein